MKGLLAVVLLLSSISVWANTSIQNDTINVDGDYSARPVSQVEKMKQLRRKLEKQNELLVKKQIEQMRYKQELKMMRKIQKAFNENMKLIEKADAL